jgi:hypothetical protein
MSSQNQIIERINELKIYISNVDDKLKTKNYKAAINIIRAINNPISNNNLFDYNPNSYVIELLKSKNVKLKN